MNRIKLYFYLLLCIFYTPVSYAQMTHLDSLENKIRVKSIDEALYWQANTEKSNFSEPQRAKFFYLSAQVFHLDNRADEAFDNYLKAREIYQVLDSVYLVAEINLKLAGLARSMINASIDYEPYLNAYLKFAIDQNNPSLLSKAYMRAGSSLIDTLPNETLKYYRLGLNENNRTADTLFRANLMHNLAVLYSEKLNLPDSSLFYFDEAYKIYLNSNIPDYMAYVNIGRASVLRKQGKYDEAINQYLMADSLPLKEFRKNVKSLLYGFMSDTYIEKLDYRNAYKYLKSHIVIKDSINEIDQNVRISEIQTKFNFEKKENENLKLKQNKFWLISVLIGLGLILIVGFFAYKSQIVKKRLAESDREIEQQKVENLLREQELVGIDAMIAGQEKERQHIANDLHDNLGSILATLKLHFQNLKVKKGRLKEEEDMILEKTDNLIDEAYQKVRTMAHAKHSGLKAKEGLLSAVKNFAAKVSLVNKLLIQVEDHGLEERLENSLEITFFRIIQELVTNVVKHSQASESTIHLTHHDNNINIMVEDNGIGFHVKEISKKEGMGLYSIQKRVENLGGTVTIDAILNKGTSIIIDIPLV